eukprot:3245742-Pleurochrysis_carterae.AAC.4
MLATQRARLTQAGLELENGESSSAQIWKLPTHERVQGRRSRKGNKRAKDGRGCNKPVTAVNCADRCLAKCAYPQMWLPRERDRALPRDLVKMSSAHGTLTAMVSHGTAARGPREPRQSYQKGRRAARDATQARATVKLKVTHPEACAPRYAFGVH